MKYQRRPRGIKTERGQQKNRRAHDVPIRRELASLVADQIEGKSPAARVFMMPKCQAEMLRYDMIAAGLPMIDEDGLPLMFHSFRATCATFLGNAGLSSKDIAAITGHKSREMVDKYTHSTREAAKRAIESLPTLRMTGTDDTTVCPRFASAGAEQCASVQSNAQPTHVAHAISPTGPPAADGTWFR